MSEITYVSIKLSLTSCCHIALSWFSKNNSGIYSLKSKHSRKTTVSVSQIVIEQKVFCFLNTKKILILFILKYYTTQVVISATAADAGFGWNTEYVGILIIGEDIGGVPVFFFTPPPPPVDVVVDVIAAVRCFMDDGMPRLGGGAIKAASGSSLLLLLLGAGVIGMIAVSALLVGIIGGGAKGFATSVGSSPGNIQRLSFSS